MAATDSSPVVLFRIFYNLITIVDAKRIFFMISMIKNSLYLKENFTIYMKPRSWIRKDNGKGKRIS